MLYHVKLAAREQNGYGELQLKVANQVFLRRLGREPQAIAGIRDKGES